MSRAMAIFGVALMVATAAQVRAQPGPAVELPPDVGTVLPPPALAVVFLEAPRCERIAADLPALAGILGIELGGDGVERLDVPRRGAAAAPPSDALAVLRLECTGRTGVELVVDDRATNKTVRRRLELDDVAPDARPRVTALALAELLRASWAELVLAADAEPRLPPSVHAALRSRLDAAQPAPRPEAPDTATDPAADTATATDMDTATATATATDADTDTATDAATDMDTATATATDTATDTAAATRDAPARRRHRGRPSRPGTRLSRIWRVEGLVGLGFYPRESTLAPSLRGVVHLPVGAHVTVAVATGFADDVLGDVEIRHFALGGGYALFDAGGRDVRFELDARLELGWSVAQGRPDDPRRAAGGAAESPYVAASFVGVTHGRISRRLAIELAIAAGVADGVRAFSRQGGEETETGGMDGLFFDVGLGIAFLP